MDGSGETTGRSSPLSTAVIERVATLEGVDPLRLDVPLNDAIDPDALDSLFECAAAPGHVVFEYCGYEVFADSSGRVSVEEALEGPLDPAASLRRHAPGATSSSPER